MKKTALLILSLFMLGACDCYFSVDVNLVSSLDQKAISEAQIICAYNDIPRDTLLSGLDGQFEYQEISGTCNQRSFWIDHPHFKADTFHLKNGFRDTLQLQPKAKDPLKLNFNPRESFSIQSLRSTDSTNSSAPQQDMCSGWTLNEDQVKTVIASGKAINGREWHYLYSVLPCDLRGSISQGGKTYGLYINGGAYYTLSDQDSTWMFGCMDPDLDSLFVETVWREDEE